jgi:hypothetical protein
MFNKTKTEEKLSMDLVEAIAWQGQPLCYIVRRQLNPDQTTFLTPADLNLQVGYVVHPAGHEIQRHVHRQIERTVFGTCEVLVVRKGRCFIDVYSKERELVAMRELGEGDVMIMVAGGHGFRMLEDTVLLEVKQGPYPGIDEKERF